MPNRENPPRWSALRRSLADRVRLVRERLYGPDGAAELAESLGIPERTWLHYESGVTIPAEVILRFVALTKVDPSWLIDGQGSGSPDLPASSRYDEMTRAASSTT